MMLVVTMHERRRGNSSARLISLAAIALVLIGGWLLRPRDGSPPVVRQPAPPIESAQRPAESAQRSAEPGRRSAEPAQRSAEPAGRREPSARSSAESSVDRYDLEADEARGGHTLARHVGRTDAQLRERLANERGISTASTYTSRVLAERTVSRTLRENKDRLEAWTSRRGKRPNLALDYHGPRDEVLGRSIRRGQEPEECTDAIVVLRWAGRDYYVLTTYPECGR
jgi:hypothetical protein